MEYKFVPIIVQSDMCKLAERMKKETDLYVRNGYDLYKADTVYNRSSYSALLIFKRP